jgi:2-polyprenyl-3-methyl-5-hydroxy-6-metoxy-1,4-benzoquinol methylase
LGFKKVAGLDTSEFASREARKRGLDVKEGTLETVKITPDSFGVVMSQDVIEHITKPVEEMKRIYKILRPGGLVFIVTPEMDGGWHNLMKGWWYHYKKGEHVSYFSKKTMELALKKAGFTEIKTKETWHVMSWEYILRRMQYYSPVVFGGLLKIISKLGWKEKSLLVKTGEFEAWARRPEA